jgi:hypothetical protein
MRRGEARKSNRLRRNAGDARASFEKREPAIGLMLRDNRFWIGEALYPRYVEYSKRQRALVHAYQGITYRLLSRRATEPIRTRAALDEALARVQKR